MAIDNRLQIFDENDNLVDYDIMATDVKFADGKDLPTKLDELEDEIGEGGYTPPEGGIPKTDLAPAVQHTLDDVANKVDKVTGKGLSSNDYTDTDKAKVDGLKPVATSGSYNDLTDKPTIPTVPTMDSQPTAGNTTHTVSSDGVASALNNLLTNLRIVNGEWYIGNTATGVSAQGPQGSCAITGDGSNIISIIVNNLVTGGAGNILSAEQGKVLKGKIDEVEANVERLFNNLGNIAFWDAAAKAAAAPVPLDWGNPKHSVAVTNSLSNSVITRNSEPVSGSFQAEEGSTVTLIVAPVSGYALTNVSYVKDSDSSASATSLGDGTYKIEFVMGGSDVTVTVSGISETSIPITIGTLSHCAVPSGVTNPTGVVESGTVNIQLQCDAGYSIKSADVTISGATVGTITNVGQIFTIPITHDGNSQSVSIAVSASVSTPYQGDLVLWLDGADDNTALASKWVDRIGGVEFPISGAITRSGSHYQFSGTWGQKDALMGSVEDLIFANTDYTVEVVFKPTQIDKSSLVCAFGKQTSATLNGLYFSLCKAGTGDGGPYVNGMYLSGTSNVWKATEYVANSIYCFGLNKTAGLQNGAALSSLGKNHWNYSQGGRWIGGAETDNEPNMGGNTAFVGDIYAVRIYRGQLTAAQMLANQKVDNERYSLGLTLPDSVS